MLYLIGGAPRTGKSILGQRFAAEQKIGWISSDLLIDLLRVQSAARVKTEWNAAPEAIAHAAEWFFPYLERFVWGIDSLAQRYVIEGVDFLPAQTARLSKEYQIQAVFLGCSKMTLGRFEQFPGHSRGYANLPENVRAQMARDIPRWSSYVQQEAERFDCPFVDMIGDFPSRLAEAMAFLKGHT